MRRACSDTPCSNTRWSAGGGLLEAVADGVTEADRWRQHGDDVGAAVGVGVAQLGVEVAGVARRGRRCRRSRGRRSRRHRSVPRRPSASVGSVDEVDPRPRRVVRRHHPGRPRRAGWRRRAVSRAARRRSRVGMPPGRRICGGSTVQSTIVLSTPTGLGPPSRITSVAGSSSVAELVEDVTDGRRAHRAVAVRRRGGQAAARCAPAPRASPGGPGRGCRPCRGRR